MTASDMGSSRRALISFFVLYLLLSLLLRGLLLERDLPYYSTDENEVVEPALTFISGDWREWNPRWFLYGPLLSYILAAVYRVFQGAASLALGWTPEDFFFRAFFEPTAFYVLGRAVHMAALFGIAGMMFLFARRYLGRTAAAAALVLGGAPLLDLITGDGFTIRVDTLQGLLGLSSLHFAARFGSGQRPGRDYAAAAAFAALGLNTKPLTGLLLLPVLLLAHVMAVWSEDTGSPGRKLRACVLSRRLWSAAGVLLLVYALTNPFSLISFSLFLSDQTRAIGTGQGGVTPGYDLSWMVRLWGWPLVLALGLGVIAAGRSRNRALHLLLAYTALYFGAFAFLRIKPYWLIPVMPAALLLAAHLVSLVASRLSRIRVRSTGWSPVAAAILVSLCLVIPPWKRAVVEMVEARHPGPSIERRTDRAAQRWIEANVPPHKRILLVGFYAQNLPRIVADDVDAQGEWGEYFMHRRRKPGWAKALHIAYDRFRSTGRPVYGIGNIEGAGLARLRKDYAPDPRDEPFNRLIAALDEEARRSRCEYIVTASPTGYSGPWEGKETSIRLATFNEAGGFRGDEVKVFRLE